MKTQHDKINIVTLGCSKNTVDSEMLAGQLNANKLKVVYDSNDTDAKTVIINTCGFIKDAKQESVDTILQYAQAKQDGLINKVFVMGCLSERYKPELAEEIDNIDGFYGANELPKIVQALGARYKNELIGERITSTPPHYAYLKVSEGCNRNCSFCAIPLMRGKHQSKSIENIINEANKLAGNGVRELMIIAQDLSYYGLDIYKQHKLAELLDKLTNVKGIDWIRLHYLYPAQFPVDILPLVAEKNNICKYIDLPFQHIADGVLTKMRRGINKEKTYQLIEKIRNTIPGVALRTTLMTGHPGESEKEFEELKQFVQDVKFERLGVFTYSEEEDTFGASNLNDTVPEEEKIRRANEIMEVQQQISNQHNQQLVGNQVKIIIDRREGDYYVGRTEYDSPEVDNEVLIDTSKSLDIGSFYIGEITFADDFDIYADIL